MRLRNINLTILLVLFLATTLRIQSQNLVEYTITVTSVTHNFQCGSDGFFSQPEPRWKIRAYHVGGAVPAYTVINLGDGVSCGTYTRSDLLAQFTNSTSGVVCASQFEIDYQSWEEDGCGSDNDYNGGGCANNDENVASATNTYNFSSYPENTNNTITVTSANGYNFNVRLNWNKIDAPTILGTSVTTGCAGSTATLNASAPETITGGDFYWYTTPTGGASVGTGSTFSPVIAGSTTYYVAYGTGTCETDRTAVNITETSSSTMPTALSASPTSLCGPGTINLTIVGGTLGAGAQYELYSGSCGGTLIASGASPSFTGVSVSTTTDFFARISGTCNTTSCVTVNVPLSTPSTDPTGASASVTTTCSGDPVTLSVVGGSLGTSATWQWYSGSCGGVSVGSGASIAVNPTTSTTYYVRAEGGCGNTACQSVSITVDQPSVAATAATASPAAYCSGGSSVLSITGGTLGTGADWVWYEGGCGLGTPVGTGPSISVSPTITTDYYVRAEGTCNNTSCTIVTVTVNQSGSDPTGIAATNTNICPGQSTVLSVVGGSLGSGATWEWYEGSCGGLSVGTGNTISVSPSATTTYFVRAEGTCGSSSCATVLITVGVGTADPTSATVINDNICPGDTSYIFVTGGPLPTDYEWVWYTGACGAIPVGIGDTIAVTPNSTTTYYVRATGTCGNTACVSATVTVLNGSITADGITTDANGICPGTSINLNVNGGMLVSGAQWVWYENSCGGTSVGTGSTLAVNPTTSTAYYVRAEGGTCGNTECVSILINVLDAYTYMVAFDDLCGMGAPFELNQGIPEGGTYSGTGVSAGVFYPSVAGYGVHTISYDYTADNGCVVSASADLTIDSIGLSVSAVVELEECSSGGVTIVATPIGGAGGYTYQWSDGSTSNPLLYAQAGTYDVAVTDVDNCSATMTGITVDESLVCIELANTFTPNADGTNDTWNLDFTAYSNASLEVYSKWGVLVYQTDGLTVKWDGNDMNGNQLPAGTYYYIINLDQGSITQNGPITIVR